MRLFNLCTFLGLKSSWGFLNVIEAFYPPTRGDLLPIYFKFRSGSRDMETSKRVLSVYLCTIRIIWKPVMMKNIYYSEEELRVSVQRNIIITFKNSNLLHSTFQPLCHLNVHILRGAWREPMKTLKNKNKNKIYIYIYYTYFHQEKIKS